MPFRYIMLCIGLLGVITGTKAQTIVSDDYAATNSFYTRALTAGQEVAPLRNLRQSDVVWETNIWRTIDLREKINQYFYYPIEPEGVHGRKNFAYLIWNAIVANEIPIYKDDECKIPIDNDYFVAHITKGDTIELQIIDEEDEESFEYKTVVVPHEFSSENILQIRIREAWYIEKNATQQWVQPLSLSLVINKYKTFGEELVYLGMQPLFWIPLLSPSVRNLLTHNESYFEDNIAALPSWQYIFDTRSFDSFITRESNRFNRSISSYLTGEDAILEAERIENKLLEISLDMWEY